MTLWEGTNTLVGVDPEAIGRVALLTGEGKGKAGRVPELWDGETVVALAEFHP